MILSQFTKRQKFTFIVISLVDLCSGICVSLQAPFYPREAELKGCSATEYGLVFGIFELIICIMSPYFGARVYKFGAKFMFNIGIFTTSTCCVLFGLLDLVPGHYPFFILSMMIRIIEAVSEASFLTASFAIIANEFPNNIATTFSSLETFFGLGLIVGPTIGGFLYELGGYKIPFAILGGTLFISGLVTLFILPNTKPQDDAKHDASVFTILMIPTIAISAFSSAVSSFSIGFAQATLEPHLRQFNLNAIMVGLVMVINGGTYAIFAPIVGWLCDNRAHPKIISLFGALFLTVGFCLIGPLPLLITSPSLTLTCIGLFLQGLGVTCQAVTAFIDSLRACFEQGYPNNIQTFGLVSGLWTSSFSMGAFLGPTISGIFYDFFSSYYLIIYRKRNGYVQIETNTLTEAPNESDFIHESITSQTKAPVEMKIVVNSMNIERVVPLALNSAIASSSYKSDAFVRRGSAYNESATQSDQETGTSRRRFGKTSGSEGDKQSFGDHFG